MKNFIKIGCLFLLYFVFMLTILHGSFTEVGKIPENTRRSEKRLRPNIARRKNEIGRSRISLAKKSSFGFVNLGLDKLRSKVNL